MVGTNRAAVSAALTPVLSEDVITEDQIYEGLRTGCGEDFRQAVMGSRELGSTRVSRPGEDFRGINLAGAHFGNGKSLTVDCSANFVAADFEGADLREVWLVKARLAGANFSKANLSASNLTHAQLMGANLVGTDLNKARLVEASLAGANLAGADLTGADIQNANFAGADLTDVKGLTLEQLRSAKGVRPETLTAYGAVENLEKLMGPDVSNRDLPVGFAIPLPPVTPT